MEKIAVKRSHYFPAKISLISVKKDTLVFVPKDVLLFIG